MADKKCCICRKIFKPHEQVAALNENAVLAIEEENPGLDLGSSVATDSAGNRCWVICIACAQKYISDD